MFTVNRVVALLTPVFAAGAAVGSAWLTKHFPGLPTPTTGELLTAEIAGATAAIGGAVTWLKGHQAWEKTVADIVPQHVIDEVVSTVKRVEAIDPKLAGEIEAIARAEVNKVIGQMLPDIAKNVSQTQAALAARA